MKRILGIDVGSKKVGFAVSDPLGITAQGLNTVNAEETDPIQAAEDLVRQYDVKEVVVGLPLNMDGSEGSAARASVEFADRLKEKAGIPVKLWDERLSTAEVERAMLEADISRQKRKKAKDKLSAQIILQSYLDAGQFSQS